MTLHIFSSFFIIKNYNIKPTFKETFQLTFTKKNNRLKAERFIRFTLNIEVSNANAEKKNI